MDDLKIFIGGQWRHGGGNPMQSHFPADGSINATLNAASLDDLEEAVDAGERAWRDPAWRNSLPHVRAKILHKVADLIESRVDELAQMQSRDNGKPLAEACGLVMSAAGTARYFAAACELLEGELPTPRQPDLLTLSRYEPLGVVAAITPWNSPIASEMQKVAPAIAAGNAVILKPAEATPLMALELARIFEQAGLPAGLLSVLPGKGSVIGDALARHPRVRKISFTGGTTTGRHLAHVAAEKLIPASLELGGKSPTIVLEDADIEQAARGICYGIFSSAGQACIAGSRLFIHEYLRPADGEAAGINSRAARRASVYRRRACRTADRRETSPECDRVRRTCEAGRGPRAVRRRDPRRSRSGKRQLFPANHYRRATQQRPRMSGRDLRPGAGGDAVWR